MDKFHLDLPVLWHLRLLSSGFMPRGLVQGLCPGYLPRAHAQGVCCRSSRVFAIPTTPFLSFAISCLTYTALVLTGWLQFSAMKLLRLAHRVCSGPQKLAGANSLLGRARLPGARACTPCPLSTCKCSLSEDSQKAGFSPSFSRKLSSLQGWPFSLVIKHSLVLCSWSETHLGCPVGQLSHYTG